MGRRIGSTSDPEWTKLLRGFRRSAFRLEALQHYSEPEEAEAFARFRAGQDPLLDLAWWLGLAAGHTRAGRRMSRVRVIVEPPSDYTRFELAHYPAMVAAGDDIRIIPTTPGNWPAGLPQHDFWLFDDQDVWILDYDPAGVFLGAELTTDPQDITDHLHWRDAALAQSISVHDYLAATAGQRAS
jgi:hypothetical protein